MPDNLLSPCYLKRQSLGGTYGNTGTGKHGRAAQDIRVPIGECISHCLLPKGTRGRVQPAAACRQPVGNYTASETCEGPGDGMASGTAELPGSTASSAAFVSAVALPAAPVFAFCGRFGTRGLTRRASAAYRMREPADAVLMPL